MRRGLLIWLLVPILGMAAIVVSARLCRHPVTPEKWLQQEFSLQPEQAACVAALHSEYQRTCAENCARIAEADARLRVLIGTGTAVTPEIRAAIAETDNVRTGCRVQMLDHFYRIADTLPPDKRQKYLGMVLPLILQPTEMQKGH